MTRDNQPLRTGKKPELTDADKALLEAEPDWERMGQGARRLLSAAHEPLSAHKAKPRQSVVKKKS